MWYHHLVHFDVHLVHGLYLCSAALPPGASESSSVDAHGVGDQGLGTVLPRAAVVVEDEDSRRAVDLQEGDDRVGLCRRCGGDGAHPVVRGDGVVLVGARMVRSVVGVVLCGASFAYSGGVDVGDRVEDEILELFFFRSRSSRWLGRTRIFVGSERRRVRSDESGDGAVFVRDRAFQRSCGECS